MMEPSSNLNLDLLHHHHQHEDFHGSSSSSPAPPFHFASTSTRTHEYWNQHLLLNSGDHDQFMPAHNGVHSTGFMIRPSRDMPMVPDLGIFQWPAATDQQGYNMMMMNLQSQDQQLVSRSVKEELSGPFARLAGVDRLQDYRLMMPPPSPRPDFLGFDPVGSLGSFGTRGSFVGTANISGGSDRLPMPYSDPMVMDAQALDLSASARFRRTLCAQPTMDDMALLREDLAYGPGQLQPPAGAQHASLSQNKISRSPVRANGNGLEYKANQSVAKKPRLESRGATFTPFKVRKEKLGDRIAALQQLVAPFGKTDTASVLMEAIGYIKFLQDQVETLSVPYMRSSNNKKMRTSEETSTGEREEPKLDLRSRGLCLVPLSCTSYVTNENEGVWSPPNYRGGT
ncbi:transcription factor bHLH110 [Iris pallida]|uniref:Transcription factor bHLH110 n=1 Tax=Iris pallida TaxID=29817 RepID=A0AAX6DZC6_IRIPA|nr:transcription factor bHLH110 [Iris pallida]